MQKQKADLERSTPKSDCPWRGRHQACAVIGSEPSVFASRPLRACLKIAFRRLCVPLCGRFGPDDGGVAGYAD